MTETEAKKRIIKLQQEINHHRRLYHVEDRQEISDAALDSLKHELAQLEQQYPKYITPDSPTQRVGGVALEKFEKVVHRQRMMSLTDVFGPQEIEEWIERIRKLTNKPFTFYAEYKVDGLALSLVYENGKLRQAATRGDGHVGENVTENAKTIEAIPLTLPEYKKKYPNAPTRIEIRGEVFMPKQAFETLNNKNKKEGKPLFANPRNAAAGAVRQLDPKITASRKLSFLGYDVVTDIGVPTHADEHVFLEYIGIPSGVKRNKVCSSTSDIEAFHAQALKERDHLPFWVDGVVVSVNQNNVFTELGVVGKAPRGAVAYKYPAEQGTTIVEDITVQVGRTGVLTPVAHLKPVQLAGTTVSRATLHNEDEIRRLGLKIGDTVVVEKAGDIIPDVVQVLPALRTGKEKQFRMPNVCPMCRSRVTKQKGEVNAYCTNKNCFAVQQERLEHFVSKYAFDIEGLGPKILEQLQHEGLIKNASDLFTLTAGDLEPLERFAEKSAQNLVDAIAARKQIPLHRFIFALGIRHVGEQTARVLAETFGTLSKLERASVEELAAIHDVGDVVAESIYMYFHEKEHKEFLSDLQSHGVLPLPMSRTASRKTPLSGKTIVVTGTLDAFSRDGAKEAIRKAGGTWSSSVSTKTDFVVVGKDPGSKAEKARTLGVKRLTESDFLSLLQ